MQNNIDNKIIIIGAGISGLIVAIELEKHGYSPIIIEQTSSAGGRVKTDVQNNLFLDQGFQVMLSAYPAVQRYIDVQALQALQFLPGAIVFNNARQHVFGDPLRHISFLIPTAFSALGTLADKWKIFTLSQYVKKNSVENIFEIPEISTLEYLKNYGFSERIIQQFFKPFYTGIFLEPNLQTSCRMFLFVFKMFAEGAALLPKHGIQAVIDQLINQLQHTTFLYNTTVANVVDHQVILANNTSIYADAIVIASGVNQILKKSDTIAWHSCKNLYFNCRSNTIRKPIIGLIADSDALINNIFFLSESDTVLSVTIVKKHNLSNEELIQKAKQDLLKYCSIIADECIAVKQISNALPIVVNLKYAPIVADITINKFTFLAGDYLANGSLNAAMLSGALAANCVHTSFK